MTITNIIEIGQKYNNTDRMTIKNNIREQIKLSKYHNFRDELAEEIGISRYTLNSYCNVRGNSPEFVTALKLTEVLDITINKLTG